MIKLYSYWRSSAAYRVRIGLNLKGIEHEIIPVNLLKDGGEQHQENYRRLNPQHLIPTLIDGDVTVTQSLAILEYLDEKYPDPALLPAALADRSFARQLAQIVACDIHPLNNLRVLKYLSKELGIDDASKDNWYQHWLLNGFKSIELLLKSRNRRGPYCLSDHVTLADVCLIPQMYNAHRFNIPLEDFPILCKIEQECLDTDAFQSALPENQPDAK